jgi:hypothetical protein
MSLVGAFAAREEPVPGARAKDETGEVGRSRRCHQGRLGVIKWPARVRQPPGDKERCAHKSLALRPARIFPERAPLTELAVATVNQQLRLVLPCVVRLPVGPSQHV